MVLLSTDVTGTARDLQQRQGSFEIGEREAGTLLRPGTIHPLFSKTSRIIASNEGTPSAELVGNLAEVREERAQGRPQAPRLGTANTWGWINSVP